MSCEESGADAEGDAAQAVIYASIALTMLAMGIELQVEDLRVAIKKPKGPAIGLLCQSILNPLFFIATVSIMQLPKEQAVTAVLIGSSPGGLGSNFLSWIMGGNVALSVLMTSCSTALAFGLMPFWVWFSTDVILDVEGGTVAYSKIAVSLCMVILPAALGILLQFKVPGPRLDRLCKLLKMMGIVMLLLLIGYYGAQDENREAIRDAGWRGVIAAMLLNLGGIAVGYCSAAIFRLPLSSRRTVGVEVGTQNTTIPLSIILSSYEVCQQQDYLALLFCYVLLQGPIGLLFTIAMGLCYSEKGGVTPVMHLVNVASHRWRGGEAVFSEVDEALRRPDRLEEGTTRTEVPSGKMVL